MPIKLAKESEAFLIGSLKRYAAEELDLAMGDLKAKLFLDYVLREIGPTVYNQAVADEFIGLVKAAISLLRVGLKLPAPTPPMRRQRFSTSPAASPRGRSAQPTSSRPKPPAVPLRGLPASTVGQP